MNKYVLVMLGLLLVALSMAVGAFLYVQFMLLDRAAVTPTDITPVNQVERTAVATSTTSTTPVAATARPVAAEEAPAPSPPVLPPIQPIPLSSLPLSDTQKTLLSGMGIDYNTFVITPEMIECAQGKLGEERFTAIVGGASPSARETLSLAGCL